MLRKATLAFSPLEFTSTLPEIIQCVSSCSLGNGIMHDVSIPWEALQTWAPLRSILIWQEKCFFSLWGKSKTEDVDTTRAKEPIPKHHKQEFGRFPVQLYHQIHECATAPFWIHSGNQPLLHSPIIMNRNQRAPSCSQNPGLVQGCHCLKGILNVVSFQEIADWAWPCLVCTSGEKQPRARSYKLGRISTTKTPVIKRLEETCLLHTFTSVYEFHHQCLLAQESHPCLFPTTNSPIIMAKTTTSCLFFSDHWCAARIFLCLKSIPKVYSVEEDSDLVWEISLFNISSYQHIASLYKHGKMDISQTSQTSVWKHHGCREHSTQWTDTIPSAS